MTDKLALCGAEPWHRINSCPDCNRIWRAQPTCRTCHMRFYVNLPRPHESFNPMVMSKATVKWLENAARVFDEYSDEPFTAHQFISWLMPDMTGRGRPDRPYDGLLREQGENQGHWPPVIDRLMGHGGQLGE